MSRYVYLLTDRVEILSLTENLKFKLFPRSKLEVINTLLNKKTRISFALIGQGVSQKN